MTETPIGYARQHSWLRRIATGLLVLLLLLLGCGFLYENISEARDRRFNPMAGRLVDVGGRKMHIDCTGAGSPAVILDSGLGDTYLSWRKVQPQIADFTLVCSYDRAGLGYSEPSQLPRTSEVIAKELHALLQASQIAPPYVLVGHSMGGFDVRLYASLYRNQVAGMVLVDSSHPDQEQRIPQALRDMLAGWAHQLEFMEFTIPVGIPRLLSLCSKNAVLRAAECDFKNFREKVAEEKAFSVSAAQTAATPSLGDLPLAVISHDPGEHMPDLPADVQEPMETAFSQMQQELAHLSTNSSQTVAKNSSHQVQLDRPDIVVENIRKVVQQARATQAAPVHPGVLQVPKN